MGIVCMVPDAGPARELPSLLTRFRHSVAMHSALALLALSGLACQDQQNLPLGPSDAQDPQSLAARLLFADPCRDIANKSTAARDLLRAVNAERVKAKLPALKPNDTLTLIAEFYACRLVEGDFFSHVDPFDGSTVDRRASDFGYPFLKIGENLAAGQRDAEQTLLEWLNSPGHKANILDPSYTDVGVAVKEGHKSGPFWVLEFGRPITAGDEPQITPQSSSRPAD
jgi:uncharacterized protein YkwD